MNEHDYRFFSDLRDDINVGDLVRFVYAPPRYEGESWRPPGHGLDGTTAVVLSEGREDGHQWGGIFSLYHPEHGYISHYGDFLEVAR